MLGNFNAKIGKEEYAIETAETQIYLDETGRNQTTPYLDDKQKKT